MRIGELARRTGVGVSTLRAWERRFQFLQPDRSSGGHRLYPETDVDRVEAVLRLVSEGLTLNASIARVASVGTGALPEGEGEAFLYGQVLQGISQGVWVSQLGHTRYANRRMCELMGCTLDELVSTPVLEFHDPAQLAVTKERGASVRGGQRLHFTQELRRFDGSTFLARVETTPLFNQTGQYEGAVALIEDVTVRAAVNTQTRFRAALLDSIAEAVAAANPDGTIAYVNAAAERLFGWRASDVIGQDGREVFAGPDASEEANQFHRSLLSGKRNSGDLTLRRRDGTLFLAHVTGAPAFDENGTLIGLIAVITDLTERNRRDREQRVLELQTETLALLSAHALGSRADSDLSDSPIVHEAVEATRRLLKAERVRVLDVVAGSDLLEVRSVSPAASESTAVPGGSRSFAGYTALAGKVVVVGDARDDPRFEATKAGPGSETVSAVCAPIFGAGGVSGVLTAESSVPNRFDHSTDHFVQGVANIIGIALLGSIELQASRHPTTL
jgi:PAS domain S-box-containing protein